MNKKLFMIAIALVVLAIVAAPVTAIPAIKALPSPGLLAPANNAKFTYYPHTVMLEWKPVVDERVSSYLVECEVFSPYQEQWFDSQSVDMITTDTWYQLILPDLPVAYQNYRWRVTTLASVSSSNSAPSNWRYFSFPAPNQPEVRLTTVRLVSPEKNAQFSVGEPHSYEWEIVPGASLYQLYHQKLNAENEWMWDPPTVVLGYISVPFTTTSWSQAGTYRWRVVAFEAGSGTGFSNSPWRYFTVA